MASREKRKTKELKRVLGLGDAFFLVVGSVFGSGIFLTTGIVANELPYSGLIWMAWAAGGVVTMAGALCYGELGGLYPAAGGPYIYLREAFGTRVAFFFGWTFFWIIGGGGIAALAVGFADYATALWPAVPAPVAAIVGVTALSLFNALGVFAGARLQSALAFVRVGTIAALVAGAVAFVAKSGFRCLSSFWPSSTAGFPAWTAFGTALIAIFWAYDGWYSVNCAAEEIKAPQKTIPRSLLLGTASVVVLYLAANIVYSMALPMDEIRGVIRIGEAAAASLFGSANAPLFALVIALAVLGCLGANILYCARVPFAMARDGLFFPFLGRVHPRTGAPVNALLGQMVWASLVCLSGTYEQLIEFVMFAAVLFYGATGAAVIVLRRKLPSAARPCRVWGYPVLPAAYVIVNGVIMIALVLERPLPSLAGAAIIFSGAPAYAYWKGRSKRGQKNDLGAVACPPG
jgi:APA family basic amino acid/polyamine antiporter